MSLSEADSDYLVPSLRSAWASGSTPSELIQLICSYFGKPADALHFETITLMMIAFRLSLAEARTVLEAPVFGYRPIEELSEFNTRFGRMLWWDGST